MVAHVAYPQVTGDNTPASLSKKWISDILRKKIGYRGLIVSDDLDMGGVLASASIEEAAVETLRAGADLFLVCQKEEHVWRAYEAVFKRAESDKQFAKLVAAKAKRVWRSKKRSQPTEGQDDSAAIAEEGRYVASPRWEFTRRIASLRDALPGRGARAMIVAGVMSGTSADGINVALVRIQGRGFRSRLELLAHYEFPYPPEVRRAVLQAMNAKSASVADLVAPQLSARRSLCQRRARGATAGQAGVRTRGLPRSDDLSPGQCPACFSAAGRLHLADRRRRHHRRQLGVPVVSDFRPADMAAGGKGAPLVPFLDYVLFRHRRYGRIVQNIGGIGNLTAIPPRATPEEVVAFDTGPGNMVIDAIAERLFDRPYDRNGRLAAKGEPIERVLRQLLRRPFFRQTAAEDRRTRSSSAETLCASCCGSAAAPTITISSPPQPR